MKTFIPKKDQLKRERYIIDASKFRLGRLATRAADIIRGKHKPTYTPHLDTGDYLVVINSDKINVTGNKKEEKIYHKATGYIGNLKSISLGDRLEKDSTGVIKDAIAGMIPNNKLKSEILKKLSIYKDDDHDFKKDTLIKLEHKNE